MDALFAFEAHAERLPYEAVDAVGRDQGRAGQRVRLTGALVRDLDDRFRVQVARAGGEFGDPVAEPELHQAGRRGGFAQDLRDQVL